MNRVLDFLFNVFGFSDNFRMALNKDYEVEISDDSEAIASEEFPSFRNKPATNIKEKNVHQSQKDVEIDNVPHSENECTPFELSKIPFEK
ncbi:unnamed protein product [Rotaria magnacalcarata]|uniref:Uncharacterized protein n=4 Tax=Rotaria magnacalcarata TaxID=392030 RepID=A0A820FIG3_9BILA|nr:unnamed protein product [Rotaria magnacalcarata]